MAIGLMFASPGNAQTAPGAPAIDPMRLRAAQKLVDLMAPPAQRQTMFDGLIRATDRNVTAAVMSQPKLKEALAARPEARAILDRFMERQRRASREALLVAMPGMFDAMARAYARRFTPTQLTEIAAFFSTGTGRVYLAESLTLMSDPDIVAWQRDVMGRAIADLPQQLDKLATELATLDHGR